MQQSSLSDWTNSIVIVLAMLALLIMPGILMYHRITKDRPVATVRMIQLLALVMIIPAIIVFGMTGKLDSSTIGTLLAALAGMFSGIAGDPATMTGRKGASRETGEDAAKRSEDPAGKS